MSLKQIAFILGAVALLASPARAEFAGGIDADLWLIDAFGEWNVKDRVGHYRVFLDDREVRSVNTYTGKPGVFCIVPKGPRSGGAVGAPLNQIQRAHIIHLPGAK